MHGLGGVWEIGGGGGGGRMDKKTSVTYEVRSPKFIWATCAQLYALAETPPRNPPHLGSNTMALLVSQDRRHLFVTPWIQLQICLVFGGEVLLEGIVVDDLATQLALPKYGN
jgi:hypothetical protein